MAIIKQTSLYEILFRFGPDGLLAGVHQIDLTRLVDDATGEVLSLTAGDAQPITAEAAGAAISAETLALSNTIVGLNAQLATAGAQIAALEVDGSGLRDAISAANSRIAELESLK